MEKKMWNKPELIELGVKSTECFTPTEPGGWVNPSGNTSDNHFGNQFGNSFGNHFSNPFSHKPGRR